LGIRRLRLVRVGGQRGRERHQSGEEETEGLFKGDEEKRKVKEKIFYRKDVHVGN